MAYITVVSGGAQPVFATDVLDGSIQSNVGNFGGNYTPPTPVNSMGPKLDFFGVAFANAAGNGIGTLFNSANVNGAVQAVLQVVEQTATVGIYQVDNTANAVNMSMAIYPVNEYTALTLQAAIRGLGTNVANTGIDVTGTTVTNVGFRLATTPANPS
jgi:hypothetical protein